MNFKKKLRIWLDLGACRGTRLAKHLGCSRQYAESASRGEKGVSPKKQTKILIAIELSENEEKQDQVKIENNIIRCARLSHHQDTEVKNYALLELDKWIEELGATR